MCADEQNVASSCEQELLVDADAAQLWREAV